MSKVTILTKPNRIVIASKGVQGPPGPEGEQGIQGPKGDTGDVTPEALAARDAAQEAASSAQEDALAAALSASAADGAAQTRVQELRDDLADPTGGAGLVATADGLTVQQRLDQTSRVGYMADWDIVPYSATPITNLLGVVDGVLYGSTSSQIYAANPGLAGWSPISSPGIPALSAGTIYPLGDGEVLVNNGTRLYRSSGWAENPTTATFAQALEVYDPVADRFPAFWGVSVAGNLVYASEYGNPKPTSWRGYLSTDYGATFTEVFNIADHWPDDKSNSHLHGSCIDPYRGSPRLWQLTADTGTVGIFYSDNLGVSWTMVSHNRMPVRADGGPANYVSMFATESGIILGSDTEPNGIGFIPRDSTYVSNPRVDVIHRFVDGAQAISHVAGGSVAVDRFVFTAFGQITVPGTPHRSRIVATDPTTRQGWVVWEDDPEADESRRLTEIWHVDGLIVAPLTSSGFLRAKAYQGTLPRPNAQATYDSGAVLGGKTNNDQRAVAVGRMAEATAGTATAVGQGAKATSLAAVAVGRLANAVGTESVAIGGENVVGLNTRSEGPLSVAIGSRCVATSQEAIAVGYSSNSGGVRSVALGPRSAATGTTSVAIGGNSIANNTEAAAFGEAAESGNRGAAIGSRSVSSGTRSVAVGHMSEATANESVALGNGAKAASLGAVAIGRGSQTTAVEQVAIGARHMEMLTPPGRPGAPATGARLWVRTVDGKEELCVRFKSGSIQVIASEP